MQRDPFVFIFCSTSSNSGILAVFEDCEATKHRESHSCVTWMSVRIHCIGGRVRTKIAMADSAVIYDCC